MASPAVQNPAPVGSESKSARKKKAKAEAAANGAAPVPAVPDAETKDSSSLDAKEEGEGHTDHPYVKELYKHIRNINKKITGMQKIDLIIADNPGVSLDDLVAQRKINADQKNAALKKPQLQAQLAQLEEQIQQYRKFDADYQSQMQKQKEDLTTQHEKELEKVKNDTRLEGVTNGAAELRKKLLIFSQFLRLAAAKRMVEEEADTAESKAFEGALLLVYGGDETAVDTAISLIEGSEKPCPSIDGTLMPFTFSQVKQASIAHAPFQTEEEWVDSVAQAQAGDVDAAADAAPAASDPTIAHAGLTELDTTKPNGVPADTAQDSITSPPQADAGDSAGNAAGDHWDSTGPGAEKGGLMEDSFEMVPRPQDELETPVSAAQQEKTSWADDQPPAYEAPAAGNQAGESWDRQVAGEQADNSWAADVVAQPPGSMLDSASEAVMGAGPQEDSDGFHQVAGRHRGRGGRGRGDGEFRGRGRGRGGMRGDGEFRGRGRGGFRGRGGAEGEFRGRGGRGRGARGAPEGQVRGS